MHATIKIVFPLLFGVLLSSAATHEDEEGSLSVPTALSEFIEKIANDRSNSLVYTHLKAVKKLEKKLVKDGIQYKVTAILEDTECMKNAECSEAQKTGTGGQLEKCKLKILETQKEPTTFVLLDLSCARLVSPGEPKPKKEKLKKQKIAKVTLEKSPPPRQSLSEDARAFVDFRSFMIKYNKSYENETEQQRRFEIFRVNMATAQMIQRKEQGTAKYGATIFADLTVEEFQKNFLGLKVTKRENLPKRKAEIPKDMVLPESFDWRDHNAVTPIKNQGMCGSCWAFSTTGNVEGVWAAKKKQLYSLSEQELVDCDKLDQGCNGGLMTNAYKEIIRLGGLENETEYPYEGDDEKCKFKKSDARVYINDSVTLPQNETEMAMYLVKNGPISIGINSFPMMFYLGGISHPWKFFCTPDVLDHGVLIVGYGVKNGWFGKKPYWIVKNSWGTWWGKRGYYYIYRGDGSCGLDRMATSAIVD